jgi:chitinase
MYIISIRKLLHFVQDKFKLISVYLLTFLFFIPNTFADSTQLKLTPTHQPIIMGYYSQWAVYSPNIHIQDLPAHLMTHLVYKSANLTANGEIEPGDWFADLEHLYPSADREEEFLGSFGQLIRIKNNNKNLKTVISIGGWGRSEHFSTLASTKQGREKIARNAIRFMQKYQFDGIEIDWQFPINITKDVNTISTRDTDPQHLNLLLKEINNQCNLKNITCLLQAVLAPYSLDDTWNAQILNNNIDLLVIDVTRLPGEAGEFAEPQSPIYASLEKRSIDTVVKTLVGYGIEQKKIILSIASFAVGIEGVDNIHDGLGKRAKHLSWGSWDSNQSGATGVYNQKNLSYFLSSENYLRLWDDYSQTSYLYNPNKYGGHFIAYENERSVAAKIDYANLHDLAGIAVRQLHNGDNTLIRVFNEYHWFKSRYFMLKNFWRENQKTLIVLIQLLSIIMVGIVIFYFLHNKKNKLYYEEKQTFNRVRYLLQGLEQPLLNLVSISEKVQERGLLTDNNSATVGGISSALLAPISNLLIETNLKSAIDTNFKENVSLKQIMMNIKLLFSLNKKLEIDYNDNIVIEILTNQQGLHHLLYNLCDFINEHSSDKAKNIYLVAVKTPNYLELGFSTEDSISSPSMINHSRLNSLYRQTSSLGFILNVSATVDKLSVLIPLEFVSWETINPKGLTFNINQQKNTSAKAKKDNSTPALQQKAVEEELPVDQPEKSNLFFGITSFNLSTTPSKDIYKGLEQACQYFIDLLNQDAKVSINHHEQLVTKLGNQSLSSRHEILVNASDITIEIVTQDKLTEQDQQLIQVLVYQTLMVQKSIQALLNEPTVLSELYELTRNKDKIKYLKAESGYTGIYIQSKKDPRYISMRLRTIKLYFDDSFLIQIHRSYLINPKKVSHVQEISKLKYQLVIGSETLPISRTNVAMLKDLYPQWFIK